MASRNDDGWLSLDCGTKKTNKQRHLAEDAAPCWVAEKDQEGQTSVLPVLPALFAVGDRTIEVKQQPFVGAATLCTFDRGQFFDVISYENQWLKVYHGKTLQYGKWWTRDIGWIQVVEEADEGVGDDTAPPFAHRRGLVPTLEGKKKFFPLLCTCLLRGRKALTSLTPFLFIFIFIFSKLSIQRQGERICVGKLLIHAIESL